MKQILYISVNSKPESQSTSKTVGRAFVNRLCETHQDYRLVELDLYHEDIPEINHLLFKRRAEPVSGDVYQALSKENKHKVDQINYLCEQFLNSDIYIIAAPMWSITFPSRLKRYLDCIIINHRVIEVNEDEVKGLLNYKERHMIYIQSSGGVYPKLLNFKLNHGISYLHDIFKFLGVKTFDAIRVEGVDMQKVGKEKAIEKAMSEFDLVLNKLN